MTPITFALLLAAIVLGTVAQLLLKAGTNAVGPFAFTLENAFPVGLRLAFEPMVTIASESGSNSIPQRRRYQSQIDLRSRGMPFDTE